MAQFIEDSSLQDWKVIGSGGFGQIYKARHRQWACDVAIKLLRYDDGTNESLLREIKRMREASSPHVLRVLGVFKGVPPNCGWATQLGVVMELMERGSLASLQKALDGPPLWPLVFRLAHQVALGINLLHSLPRPVLHLDLKPPNVLLDDSLNAKLTDFGLSRISYSVTQVSKDDKEGGGTTNYMPPEAFGLTYKPKRTSDIYSYGILIWSIVTGKQPYENAEPTRVELLIPLGQRPLLDDIKGDALGLAELKGLMQRCWDNEPEQRPRALECTTETEQLYKMHKDAIFDAVHEVLKKLAQKTKEKVMTEQVQSDQITEASGDCEEEESSQQPQHVASALVNSSPKMPWGKVPNVARPKCFDVTLQHKDNKGFGFVILTPKNKPPPGDVCELELDTNTVHRGLKLSHNNRKVTRVEEDQSYPDHPDRFDHWTQLLCRNGLTGRCYWEVEWRGKVNISVSYRGIRRKGDSGDGAFGYNDQSWSLFCSDERGYYVCHNKKHTSITTSSSVSNRVAVYVDVPAGSLSFYTFSSDSLLHLHTFNTTFTQPLYPGFAVWPAGSSVSLSPLQD